MRKISLLLAVIAFAFAATAQPHFDSAAYLRFNDNRWEKVDFAAIMSGGSDIPELTTEQKIAGLSKCWAEAKYNFANFDLVPNLNWDSVYQAYIPKVVATNTTEAYYNVLRNFYQHLRDGHTAVRLPWGYYQALNGVLPLEVRWIEGKAVVTKNTSKVKEDAAIRPGMELVAFDGVPLQQYIRQHISPVVSFSTPHDSTERIYRHHLLVGKAGTTAALTFRTEGGREFTQTLTRTPVEKYWAPYPLATFKVLKGNIGYLQLNSFNDAKVVAIFDSLFAAISKTDALIIDIRNNGGGNGGNGFEILGCLTDQPFYPGKAAIRQYKPVGRSWSGIESIQVEGSDWKPYKGKHYNKPIAVLTGAATYSAAEDFLTAFRSIKRGKLFGQPTGGSTGQPVFFTLPGGGTGYVCSKRDFFSDGLEFVGIGIQPDVPVTPTLKGVKEGRDEVLDAAVHYLQGAK